MVINFITRKSGKYDALQLEAARSARFSGSNLVQASSQGGGCVDPNYTKSGEDIDV